MLNLAAGYDLSFLQTQSTYLYLCHVVRKDSHRENLPRQLCITENDSAEAMGVPNKLNDVTPWIMIINDPHTVHVPPHNM